MNNDRTSTLPLREGWLLAVEAWRCTLESNATGSGLVVAEIVDHGLLGALPDGAIEAALMARRCKAAPSDPCTELEEAANFLVDVSYDPVAPRSTAEAARILLMFAPEAAREIVTAAHDRFAARKAAECRGALGKMIGQMCDEALADARARTGGS